MLRPSMASMLKSGDSAYSFVVAVAKRAREIAQEAEDNQTIVEEKPVKLAVEEFANGKFRLGVNQGVHEEDI
ncbi:MAG: DNA-directed RNA polymerase subunit omega [Anaerotruncus sp.]|nr:DNA-directed RNA polymerase subunit omega [Anaerotruncus sp.]